MYHSETCLACTFVIVIDLLIDFFILLLFFFFPSPGILHNELQKNQRDFHRTEHISLRRCFNVLKSINSREFRFHVAFPDIQIDSLLCYAFFFCMLEQKLLHLSSPHEEPVENSKTWLQEIASIKHY